MKKITSVRLYPWEELVRRLRNVKLMGFGGEVCPYKDATIVKERLYADDLSPCQTYVVKETIETQQSIAGQFWDIFGLNWTNVPFSDLEFEDGDVVPFTLPIIEVHEGRNIVADGMHRCMTRFYENGVICENLGLSVIKITGATHPYYAKPLKNGWEGVRVVDEVTPAIKAEKEYVDPENYKALFRDFNAQFPGIQKKR